MAGAYVAGAANYNNAGTSVVLASSGLSISDDDILLISTLSQVRYGGGGAHTWPSGFTQIAYREFETEASYGGGDTAVAWKKASSESGDYTVTVAGAEALGAIISVYRGLAASPVDDYSDTLYKTDDEYVQAAGVTLSGAGLLVMAGVVAEYPGDPGSTTEPSGMTEVDELYYAYGGRWQHVMQWYETGVSSGSTGARTATIFLDRAATAKHAFLIALSDAAASGLSIPVAMNHYRSLRG